MNSDTTNSDLIQSSHQLSLDDSRELLAEVREATQQSSQSDLHEFACLLCQILDLHERTNGGHDTAEFIATSLEEIRSVVNSDQSSSEQMALLREQAIERWGDQLTAIDEIDSERVSAHDLDSWEAADDQDFDPDADVVTPSAEEIQSLLTGLSRGSADESDPPRHTPDPPEPLEHHDRSPVSVDSLDPELREAFLDDASSCVSAMEDALLRLESDPQHADSLNQICRELHTLKGASASVGLSSLADQLHQLEDSLRDDEAAGRSPSIDSLLHSVDSIRSQISGKTSANDSSLAQYESGREPVRQPDASAKQPSEQAQPSSHAPTSEQTQPTTTEPLKTTLSQPAAFAEGSADDESVRVKSSQLNRLMDMLAELVMLRNRRETELSDLQEVYHELIGSVSKMRMLSNEGHHQAVASSSLQLSEIANDVLEVAHHVRDCARPVAEGNTAVSQFIRQFRQELVELRRTPVSGLFRRLQRVVRDAAQAESKEVRLKLLGEDAGIERSLQQRLYEPLLHIVRNSVCHGIETTEERARSGKNPVGTITLEAKSGPDLLMIEIRDDGRGLDYDAIRRRGVDSGLLAADQAASRHELSQLIFQPGFSTRQTANQVAGRGVGMDVVASTLARMRGWLEVDSEPQQGTRIRLSFPLPSVIQHAMVFRSAGQLFALPMQSVQSAGEVESDSVCLTFSDLLGCRQERPEGSCQRIVLACEAPSSSGSSGRSTRVTLLVDEIVGPEEVVVRPLPTLIKHHPYCSGATLSGMGQTVLFLDARRVVESQSHHLHRADEALDPNRLSAQGSEINNAQSNRPRVLVVDDSLSARKRVVRSLQRYPIDIVEASDGKDALEILKTQRFAAVFSDMEMPHVSGMELLAEIGSRDQADSPPVVIISSRSEDEFTNRARELGAINYLIKPLADDELDGVLRGIESLGHLKTIPPKRLQTHGEIQ